MTDGIIQQEFKIIEYWKSQKSYCAEVITRELESIQQELINKIKQEYQNDMWLRSNLEIISKLIGDNKDGM